MVRLRLTWFRLLGSISPGCSLAAKRYSFCTSSIFARNSPLIRQKENRGVILARDRRPLGRGGSPPYVVGWRWRGGVAPSDPRGGDGSEKYGDVGSKTSNRSSANVTYLVGSREDGEWRISRAPKWPPVNGVSNNISYTFGRPSMGSIRNPLMADRLKARLTTRRSAILCIYEPFDIAA